MTVTEKLVDSVDTFCASPGGCRACFVIIFIACFLHALSYGSNAWAEISEGSVEACQGLWNYCSTSMTTPDYTCCETVHNFLDLQGRSIPGKHQLWYAVKSCVWVVSLCFFVYVILSLTRSTYYFNTSCCRGIRKTTAWYILSGKFYHLNIQNRQQLYPITL